MHAENDKLEAQTHRMIEQVNSITHQVELLESDVDRYEEVEVQ
jgi:hypothetical protein